MSNEIKCPHCGEAFTVDESGYAAILNQVRDQEFQREVDARVSLAEKSREQEVALAVTKAEEALRVYAAKPEQEVLMVKDYNLSTMFGEGYTTHANMMIDDKQIFEVTSKHKCQCLYTPGHTLGSCCYYFAEEGWLFSGDTLFAGSVGRSDFPTGDAQALLKSLNHVVMRLPDEVIVYPGHGPSTTIGEERETNPFVER